MLSILPWLLTRSRSCSGERGWVGRSSSALSITPAPPPPHLPTSGSVLRAARCSSETTQATSSWGKPLCRPSAQRLFTQPLTSCALRAACCSEAVEANSELFACLSTDLAPVEGEREGRARIQTHLPCLWTVSSKRALPSTPLWPLPPDGIPSSSPKLSTPPALIFFLSSQQLMVPPHHALPSPPPSPPPSPLSDTSPCSHFLPGQQAAAGSAASSSQGRRG